MSSSDQALLADITRRIETLAEGQITAPAQLPQEASVEVRAVAESLNRLIANFEALRQFSIALANGRIETEPPPRLQLLAPLKALQASLKHVTWQAQEVAAGNLTHQVDFLGDFSAAFNSMVASLREKRRAEQISLQASKLATLGLLAGGVSHEINTPLQYLDSNLRYLAEAFQDLLRLCEAADALTTQAARHPELAGATSRLQVAAAAADLGFVKQNAPAAIDDSIRGIAQIAQIVTALRQFSAAGTAEKQLTDINDLIENTLTVGRHHWAGIADVIRDLDPSAPRYYCRASEIGQVVLNLVLNAAEAIEISGKSLPGRITVASGRLDGGLFIRVTDSGRGVPERIRAKIFEPFFTTHEVGKGKGLGLATSRDIVENKHGGRIEVGGADEVGAVFTVHLPFQPTDGLVGRKADRG